MAYGVGTDYMHGERMDPPETSEGWERERAAENGELDEDEEEE